MFEVLFLGTSASAPSAQRGLSALIVKHDDLHFLVDCGEGTTRQIQKSEIGFQHLQRILLTHGHLDHILGLGGLVNVFRHDEPIEQLEIFGGRYTLERVRPLVHAVVLRGKQSPMPLHFREITPGEFLETDELRVTAFPVFHRGVDSLGYLFEEKRHPLPPNADLSSPVQNGAKLAIVGDTGRTEDLLKTVQGADALVIESTYIDEEKDKARKFSHLTARDAAELAVRAGIKQLILTHISRRYRAKDVLAQARTVFPNTVVARDFDKFQIGGDATERGN